jgi:PBSX family phage terminase large subunit
MSEPVRIKGLITPSFRRLADSVVDHRATHFWLKGGRGSTKSSFIALMVVFLLLAHPDANAVVVRKVAKDIKDSVCAQLLWAIEMLGVSRYFKATVSPLEIKYLPTGQRIVFRGADEPERIKSIKFVKGYSAITWFEELDEFAGEEELRKMLQSLMRGGELFWVFYSYNPPRDNNSWVNTATQAGPELLDGRRTVHSSTYLDVPQDWLGREFFLEALALKDINETAYRHEYLGEVVGVGGAVFGNIEAHHFTDEEVERLAAGYTIAGSDYGFAIDPFVFVRCAWDHAAHTLRIFGEASGLRMTDEQQAEAMRRLLSDKDGTMRHVTVHCDSASPEHISRYYDLGIDAQKAYKGKLTEVSKGVHFLQTRIKRIIIDPERCPLSFKEFSAYTYRRDRNGEWVEEYPDKDNHSIDAVRYAMCDIIAENRL